MQYCQERQEQLAGSPYWHSEAMTPDGRLMFVHFQNVLMNKCSGTLMGLSSGILVHAFDKAQQINRCVHVNETCGFGWLAGRLGGRGECRQG